jgi:hypothetical protein
MAVSTMAAPITAQLLSRNILDSVSTGNVITGPINIASHVFRDENKLLRKIICSYSTMTTSKEELVKIIMASKLDQTTINKVRHIVTHQAIKEAVVYPVKHVDKTTEQYKITLKLVNKILENVEKPVVEDLMDFKDVDRLDIIKKANLEAYKAMCEEIYTHFDKHKCCYYRQNSNVVFNCLRGMVKTIGLDFVYARKDITENVNGINYRKTHYYYFIK